MSSNRDWALTEMMNEAADPARLRRMCDEVFGGVTPLRKADREAREGVVRIAIALLAAGTPPDATTDAIVSASKGARDPEWAADAVRSVIRVADARAVDDKRLREEIPIDVAISAAASYAALIDGRGVPSPELEDLARQLGDEQPNYDEAGRRAMLSVMRLITASGSAPITPSTVGLWASVNSKMGAAALAASSAAPGDSFEGVEYDDDGRLLITISRNGEDRIFVVDDDDDGPALG